MDVISKDAVVFQTHLATRLTSSVATACRVANTSRFLLQDGAPGCPAHHAVAEHGLGVAQLAGEAHVGAALGPAGRTGHDYSGGVSAGRRHTLCNQLCRAAVCERDSH